MPSLKSQVRNAQTPSHSLQQKRTVAAASDSSDDDDVPLASSPDKSTKSAKATSASKAPSSLANGRVKNECDDNPPISGSKRKRAPNGKAPTHTKKKIKREEIPVDSSAFEDEPAFKVKQSKTKHKVETENGDVKAEIKPKRKRAPKKETKEGSTTDNSKVQPGKKDEGEDEEETYRWWEAQQENDGEDKWQTLEHSGVLFPPPYEPLPLHVKMKYKGLYDLQFLTMH